MARITSTGLTDDRAFAIARARRLVRQGRSRARIVEALAAKGIGRADTQAALAALADERRDPELAAALAYAKRRHLGPYRREADADRDRELAVLARAGFTLTLARRIVEAASVEALEAESS